MILNGPNYVKAKQLDLAATPQADYFSSILLKIVFF